MIRTKLRFPSMLRASLGYSGETSWIKQNLPFLNPRWPVIYTRALACGSSRWLDLAEAANFYRVGSNFNIRFRDQQKWRSIEHDGGLGRFGCPTSESPVFTSGYKFGLWRTR